MERDKKNGLKEFICAVLMMLLFVLLGVIYLCIAFYMEDLRCVGY